MMHLGRVSVSVATLAAALALSAAVAQDSEAPAPKSEAPPAPIVDTLPQAPPSPVIETLPEPAPLPKEAPPPPIRTVPAPPTTNYSVDPYRNIVVSPDGTTVQLIGQITEGVAVQLKSELERSKGVKTIVLTSEGGRLIEGVALAHIVRKYGLNAHVEFICASACTFPLLAGKQRSIAPGALVGFHQASVSFNYLLGDQREKADEPGNKLMRTVYEQGGLSQPFIDKSLQTPPEDLWYPDVATLQSNNVINRIGKSDEFPINAGKWKSAKDYSKALEADPLWAAAKASRPEDHSFAVAAGWVFAAGRVNSTEAPSFARSMLVRRLLRDAASYPDALIEEFFVAERTIWDANGGAFNRNCDNGIMIRFPVAQPKSEVHLKLQHGVLLKMLGYPANRVKPEEGAVSTAQAQIIGFWGRMVAAESMTSQNVGRNFCREPLSYFDEMAKMPLAERVNVLRSLMMADSTPMR